MPFSACPSVTLVVILTFYLLKSTVKTIINYQGDIMIRIMFLVTLICLVLVPQSFAEIGYDMCINDCNPKSSMYSYCKSQCSYNNSFGIFGNNGGSYTKNSIRADRECIKDCTAKRYSQGYCKKLCSY